MASQAKRGDEPLYQMASYVKQDNQLSLPNDRLCQSRVAYLYQMAFQAKQDIIRPYQMAHCA